LLKALSKQVRKSERIVRTVRRKDGGNFLVKAISIIRVILMVILAGLLTACGTQPDRSIVEKAIALQVSQTQQELSRQLFQSTQLDTKISQVKVKNQQRLAIEALTAYRVQGTYDLTLKLPSRRVTQRQNSFDIYLQRQSEGKTWRLARLQPSDPQSVEGENQGSEGDRWVTQRIEE
jgi:hypothetical protein